MLEDPGVAYAHMYVWMYVLRRGKKRWHIKQAFGGGGEGAGCQR